MADQAEKGSFTSSSGFRIAVGVVVLVAVAAGAWLLLTRGRESTDDAQVDGYVTQMASRVGGTVLKVHVNDHQAVKAGDVLVEIDPRDYQIAVDKARAELADAEASAAAAMHTVPITSTTATSQVTSAQGSLDQARGAIAGTEREIDAARARLTVAQAREHEAQVNAAKTGRDLDRLKGLLAKDEVSRQQYDAVEVSVESARAAVDSAHAQVAEAEAAVRVAESRLAQARAGEQQATGALRGAQTAPDQVAAMRARAQAAQAHVEQAKASLAQAEVNLQYTTVKAAADGVVARKSVNPGQVVQPGQPLMAIVQIDAVWVTANFKENQLANMRPGQLVKVEVDAYGGREVSGKVDSIAAATGARFSLLPAENSTGNFVKVVQRVPVKIVLDQRQDADFVLRPGMSVTPTVYTR